MSSPLDQLAADLHYAATQGAVAVGHAAVAAGARRASSNATELLHVEHITVEQNGELSASVVAEQPEYVTPEGPMLVSSATIADTMKHTAETLGTQMALGR